MRTRNGAVIVGIIAKAEDVLHTGVGIFVAVQYVGGSGHIVCAEFLVVIIFPRFAVDGQAACGVGSRCQRPRSDIRMGDADDGASGRMVVIPYCLPTEVINKAGIERGSLALSENCLHRCASGHVDVMVRITAFHGSPVARRFRIHLPAFENVACGNGRAVRKIELLACADSRCGAFHI